MKIKLMNGKYVNPESFSQYISSKIYNVGGKINKLWLSFTLDGRLVDSEWILYRNTDKSIKVEVYKISSTAQTTKIKEYDVTSDNFKAAYYAPWSSGISMPSDRYFRYNAYIDLNLTLNEKSNYALVLVMPKQCLSANVSSLQSPSKVNLSIDFRIEDDRNFGNYTEIGRNGLITKSNNCSLYMNDNIIQMVSSTDGNGTGYGFKVTTDGIYYKNGTSNWLKWNPTN
jgi:hypothetical protein